MASMALSEAEFWRLRAEDLAAKLAEKSIENASLQRKLGSGVLVSSTSAPDLQSLGGGRSVVSGTNLEKQLGTILKQTESCLSTALKNVKNLGPIVVWILDADGRYTFVHNSSPGFDAQMLLGKRDEEVLPMDKKGYSEYLAMRKGMAASHMAQTRTITMELPTGVERTFTIVMEPRWEENQFLGVTCCSLDITEQVDAQKKLTSLTEEVIRRQATERELRKAIDLKEEAVRSKSMFLAIMSHEIRTPLNGVLGLAEILSTTELTKEQTELVNAMVSSGETLLAIINDILDLARLESGSMEMEETLFKPREVVKHVLQTAVLPAKGRGVAITSDISDDVPEQVLGDSLRIRQVLSNLTFNALKFTPEGGTVCIRLRKELPPTDPHLSSPCAPPKPTDDSSSSAHRNCNPNDFSPNLTKVVSKPNLLADILAEAVASTAGEAEVGPSAAAGDLETRGGGLRVRPQTTPLPETAASLGFLVPPGRSPRGEGKVPCCGGGGWEERRGKAMSRVDCTGDDISPQWLPLEPQVSPMALEGGGQSGGAEASGGLEAGPVNSEDTWGVADEGVKEMTSTLSSRGREHRSHSPGWPPRRGHPTPPESPGGTPRSDRAGLKDAVPLTWEVADTGIGIPEEAFPTLFETFTQVGSSTRRKYGGTGLGLAICKQLVEHVMGGRLAVASTVGKGSAFSFTLKCHAAEPPPPERAADPLGTANAPGLYRPPSPGGHRHPPRPAIRLDPPRPTPPFMPIARTVDGVLEQLSGKLAGEVKLEKKRSFGGEGPGVEPPLESTPAKYPRRVPPGPEMGTQKILLAEDNQTNVVVATAMLKRLGLTDVEVAWNGAEALAALQAREFDMVLMDVCMPVLDGLQVSAMVRKFEATGEWEGIPGGSEDQDTLGPLMSGGGERWGYNVTPTSWGAHESRGGPPLRRSTSVEARNLELACQEAASMEQGVRAKKRVPIIAMTANALSGDVDRCYAHGMDYFVAKPVTIQKLREMLQSFLPGYVGPDASQAGVRLRG